MIAHAFEDDYSPRAEVASSRPPLPPKETRMARFVALPAVVGLLTAQSSTTCPIDDYSAHFTGTTRTESGT